jgi:hypothetical protein
MRLFAARGGAIANESVLPANTMATFPLRRT